MDLKLCIILTVSMWFRYSYGYSDSKVNVAFVIDDTSSMRDDIGEVKKKTKFIFNNVLEHNNSQIESFILITFNDNTKNSRREPIKIRAITRDPEVFYEALDKIQVIGGGDCPELALTGIKNAVELSKPNSFIYVFTDASAKDSELENEVKSMALNKSIQITFILTGICREGNNGVFKRLAVVSSGELFYLFTTDMNTIIDYVTHSVQDPKTTLVSKEIHVGLNIHEFTVDNDMMSVLISVSIDIYWNITALDVIDAKENKITTVDVVETDWAKIVKIPEPEVGVYRLKTDVQKRLDAGSFETSSIGGIVIKASINIDFQHTFHTSTQTPITRTQPIAGEIFYMEIKVKVPEHVNFQLKKVVILDAKENVLKEIPASTIIKQKDNVYTVGPFEIPNHIFKIAIFGTNLNNGEGIKRTGLTFVQPGESPKIDKSKSNIQVNEGSAAVISCRIVKGSPLPTVSWEFKRQDSNHFERLHDTREEIHIDSAGLLTSGVYKCQANNIAGRDIHEIKLNVLYYPKIDETIENITVTKGSRAVISCRTQKLLPTPNMSWEFRRLGSHTTVRLSATDQEIHIDSADLGNAGIYKCRASNAVGTDSREITLHVQYSPTAVTIKSPGMTRTGDEVTMTCKTTGEPTPNVEWLKDGRSIRSHEKYVIYNTNTLRFVADINDSGNYTCVATNRHGSDSNTATIVIHDSPKIDKSKSNIQVNEGSATVISCRIVKGSPLPTVSWEFKRQDSNHFERLRETRQEIHIDRAGLITSGVYKCQANNIVGRDFHEIKLNVLYYPKIDKTNDNITVQKGLKTIISCRTRKLLPTPNMTWEFKGKGSHTFERLSATDQEIHIDSVNLNNAGVYKCQANNAIGRDSHEITLTVHYAPTVILEQPNLAMAGDGVTLTCKVVGEPTPHVKWFKDGRSIGPHEKYAIYKENSIRFIAALNDVGIYTCEATNELGSDSRSINIDVNEPVVIEHPGKTEYNVVEYDMVMKLPCKARGHPKPSVTWTKDGQLLDIDYNTYEQESDNTLIHKYPELSSTGHYTCTARNDISSVTQIFTVNVSKYPIPSEPMDILYLEKESSNEIECNVPHSELDNIRWFTNTKQIESNPFILRNASEKDNGIYSCRVDFEWGSESNHTRIVVGTKPIFVKDINSEKVPYTEGLKISLDCSATGKPTPKITWWHNEAKLSETSMTFELKLKRSDIGRWRCQAENPLGIITRSYLIEK